VRSKGWFNSANRDEGVKIPLKLLGSKTSGTGVLIATYQRALKTAAEDGSMSAR
jgi:hypothetical protein